MSLDFEPTREIYIIFMNTEFRGASLLKDGFRHTYAIERQALGWLCTDPSKSDLYTYILPATYNSEVMVEFRRRHPDFTILHLQVKPHCKSTYPRAGIISCVSALQYLLGVYWPFIFTPYQLYNKIIKDPPTHIEVIEWQDTKYMQHKGKQQQQQSQPMLPAESLKHKRK